jgi:ABC-2 type transport system ATP-binding protein
MILDTDVVVFNDVYKSYGKTEALRGVSFSVEPGECVALLGPNGAGKTTALEILLGLRHADGGYAVASGSVACTPQTTAFPDALRVCELLGFAAAHYPGALDIDEVLDAFDLSNLARIRAGSLSGGEQRRVALALAFVGNTDIVVLDEPSTGLDVESRRRLWSALRSGIERRTTLFTTHYMDEAEALATRVVVIDRGQVLFDGSPAAFRSNFGCARIEYTLGGRRTTVTTADTDAYIRELVRENVPFADLRISQPSFEEVFLTLTGGTK